jgi:D-inositol-3-phosphate glycosyltransferase
MRILFTSHYALPHLGGIETVVDELARALVRRGHAVTHVAAAALPAEHPSSDEPRPYRLLRVPAANFLEAMADVPYPLFSPRLFPLLRREVAAADVVHAHGYLYMSGLAALWLARRRGVPVRVLTEHVGHVDYDSAILDGAERAAIASLGRASARLAEGIVVLNENVESALRMLAPGRRVERIFNGVDTERYRPADLEERRALREGLGWDQRPRALFVGRLVAKKGIDLAIAAAQQAGARLAVVGPGRLPAGTPPGVELLGAQPPHRVQELYRAADAFLLPSRGEGFPITAQEALASGLPVVLCDDPAYAPYLDGAGRAARVAPPNPVELAAALSEVLGATDDGVRAAAREHAFRTFSWERAAHQHEELYRSLASGRGEAR